MREEVGLLKGQIQTGGEKTSILPFLLVPSPLSTGFIWSHTCGSLSKAPWRAEAGGVGWGSGGDTEAPHPPPWTWL